MVTAASASPVFVLRCSNPARLSMDREVPLRPRPKRPTTRVLWATTRTLQRLKEG